MNLDGITKNIVHTNAVNKADVKSVPNKDYSSVLKMKEVATQGISMPAGTTSREMIQNFAEWYLKQGRAYESAKSYNMAISAYEKSNSIEPDESKAVSIEQARSKAYKTDHSK